MKRLAALVLACSLTVASGESTHPPEFQQTSAPVTVARASQFDLTSKINGQTYRIMVGVPPGYEPGKPYPALYVLEANVYFATAVAAMTRQTQFRNTVPAIVIGVGYPSDDVTVSATRRWLDFTPTVSSDPNEKRKTGGGDEFARLLDEEIKPFIGARYKIDTSRQALWGHSIGGLTVLRELLTHTESFSTYLISSPSIWWDGKVVLHDEARFAKRLSEVGRQVRVLITSGSEEQCRGEDVNRLCEGAEYRMIDNASDLAERLRQINRQRLLVERYILDGETHISVSHSALTRSLRFAFPYEEQ